LSKKKQFRIKYYDYDDSELYTIIQVASNTSKAVSDATKRLENSSSQFKIIDIKEINTPGYYLEEIRKILTKPERDESSWLRKRKRKTMV